MLAALLILKPVGGGYQSPGPNKQVSIHQVHCLATLPKIHLPKFHYCLITECSSGTRMQHWIIKRSFSDTSWRGLASTLAAATLQKRKKTATAHHESPLCSFRSNIGLTRLQLVFGGQMYSVLTSAQLNLNGRDLTMEGVFTQRTIWMKHPAPLFCSDDLNECGSQSAASH